MQPRFVIVPAVQKDTDMQRAGDRFYDDPVHGAFDIYDNQEKQRLLPGYKTRAEAEFECYKKNQVSDYDSAKAFEFLRRI